MLLQYDIGVVGANNVTRALASIEAQFVRHNARIARITGTSPGARPRAGGGFSEISRAADAQKKATEKLALAEQRAAEKTFRFKTQMQNRVWGKEQRERERAERHALTVARREADARIRFAKSTIGGGASRVFGAAKAVGTVGASMAGIGGAALAASAISQASQMDQSVRRMIVNARGPGQANAYDPDALRKRLTQTAIETGTSPESLAAAGQQYVAKTGDIKTGVENMKTFATVAQATGASVEDVASAAADLAQKFDIKKPKEMADALAVLTFQGKKGAFELRDIAETFPEMAAAAQRAGMTGVGGMKTLGGLAQIARTSTGSGAEASTAVQMMMTKLVQEAPKLQSGESLGGKKVNVFEGGDATKPVRDIREVLAEIISKSGGNLTQLQDVFDVRGIRAVSPLVSAYRTASGNAAAGGASKKDATEAGRQAILKTIEDASESGGTFADVQRDAGDTMKSFSSQMEVLETQLKDVVATEIFPELIRLGPEMRKLVPAVATATKVLLDVIKFFAENKWSGLGLIVGAALTAEILKARVGQMVGGALKMVLGGAAAEAATKPRGFSLGYSKDTGATGMGAMGAAATGAALGFAVGTMIVTAGLANFENANVEIKEAGKKTLEVEKMGLDQIGDVRKSVQEQRANVNKLKPDEGFFGAVEGAWDWATGGSKGMEQKSQEQLLARDEAQLAKLEKLEAAAAVLERAGTSQEDAMKKLGAIADKLGVKINRSDGPSAPIKP